MTGPVRHRRRSLWDGAFKQSLVVLAVMGGALGVLWWIAVEVLS